MIQKALSIMVDLTPVQTGGSNGGLKPAVFSFLKELPHITFCSFTFTYLTSASSHHEIAKIARPQDTLFCVREDTPFSPAPNIGCNEYCFTQVPKNLPDKLEVDIAYYPFGNITYQTSHTPNVILIADLLHKDWRHTLGLEDINYRENYISKSIDQATKIQSISQNGIQRLQKHYKVLSNKSFYTYLPVQEKSSPKTNKENQKPYFFCPANFWKHKNHEQLLIAYNIYLQKEKNAAWDLTFTGHPDTRMEELQQLCKHLNIDHKVTFLGYVDSATLLETYQNATAMVFPSLHEGFGIPIIEGMQYGTPIITSHEFSLKELIGDACLQIDPRKPLDIAEKLSEMTHLSAESKNKLITKASHRLRLFNLKEEVEKLARVFYEIAHPKAKPLSPHHAETVIDTQSFPTPKDLASTPEKWHISISFKPYSYSQVSAYIGETPYGSTHQTARYPNTQKMEFTCYPQGKPLVLTLHKKSRSYRLHRVIQSITLTDQKNQSIALL